MVSFFYSPIKIFSFFVIAKERSNCGNSLVIAKERSDCGNLKSFVILSEVKDLTS